MAVHQGKAKGEEDKAVRAAPTVTPAMKEGEKESRCSSDGVANVAHHEGHTWESQAQ